MTLTVLLHKKQQNAPKQKTETAPAHENKTAPAASNHTKTEKPKRLTPRTEVTSQFTTVYNDNDLRVVSKFCIAIVYNFDALQCGVQRKKIDIPSSVLRC